MIDSPSFRRTTRFARSFALPLAALALVLLLAVPAAIAGSGAVPAPPANPTSADQIQNIDQVKTAIKAYYGDTPSSIPDPVNGQTTLHFPSPTGAYAHEMAGIETDAEALTGRPENQRAATELNLTNTGYPVVDSQVYLQDQANQPWLSSCAPTCSRTQYKSLTRQHIESLGFEVIANFGDQFSDLNGGFADRTFKIPNPMYFLP